MAASIANTKGDKMNTLEQARKSLAAVYQRQHVAHATARTKLIEALTYKQYQAARVGGFFQVERVARVTKSKALRLLALDVEYLAAQLKSTGAELDQVLGELEK
jgi:hypothetical protein